MRDFEIIALKYAESTIEESAVIQGGNPSVRIPISFTIYLIRTSDCNILVDAGCTTMPGWDMKCFVSPAEVLEKYGIKAEDITHVILTHSHHDHVQGTFLFENATVYIQEDEYSLCINKIPKHMNVVTFSDEFVFDENIRIKRIGGHSKGSCIVIAGEYVICGDECYTERCFIEKLPTGASCNLQRSMDFVNDFGDEKFRLLLCHDPKILPGKYGYLKIK